MSLSFKKIFTGTLFSLVLSIIFMCILAVFVYFLNIPDRTVTMLIFFLSAVSVFIGALVLAKNIPCKGLLNGLLLSAFYCAILFVAGIAANGSISAGTCSIMRLAATLAAGMLGGICGINTKNESA